MSKQYEQELVKANDILAEINERGEDAIGGTWDELRRELFTPEEIAASDLRVAMMMELVNARRERGISQKKLEELSGVKQPVIARMENGSTSPQIDTVLKVLAPLGKTLAVVPISPIQQMLTAVFGTGKGSGIAVMFFIVGVIGCVTNFMCLKNPTYKSLD